MDIERMKKPFDEEFYVLECECDLHGRILPGALLRMTQQIATDHCGAVGMDMQFYNDTHTVFLLAKQALQFTRLPQKGERVLLHTQPQSARRAVYKRVTEVLDSTGTVIAMVDSRWMLVDTQTRRILRREPEGFPAGWMEQVEPELEQTIAKTQTMEPVGRVEASYFTCDVNGHMNNSRYADIALSALPLEQLRCGAVRSMRLHYHREVPLGESFEMFRGLCEDGSWYITGMRDGLKVFEAGVTMQAENER